MLSLDFGDFATWSAVFVAAVAITVQVVSERKNRKIERRANAWSAINDQIHLINEACRDATISPADAAQRPGEILVSKFETKQDQVAANVLFFHHINLLHIVFLHQAFLNENEIEGFRRWTTAVIGGFLQAVPPLRGTLEKILSGEDLYGDDFIVFLKDMLATYLAELPQD